MLKAFQYSKCKNTFETNEDSLTSSVFQLLTYLPPVEMWDIIKKTIKDKEGILPKEVGSLQAIEYWPKWDATDTTNASFVEPDVLLSFEHLDLLIEAKRYDRRQQYRGQWENELRSYYNENQVLDKKATDKKVVLWALGGIHNFDRETVEIFDKENQKLLAEYTVLKSTWTMLLAQIKRKRNQYEKGQSANSGINGKLLIYQDLLLSFSLHGFFTGTWLGEGGMKNYALQKTSEEHAHLSTEKYDSKKWLISLLAVHTKITNPKNIKKWLIN